MSATFTPFDSTDYTTAAATVQLIVLAPGVTVVGTQLYTIGGSTTNDQVLVNPAPDTHGVFEKHPHNLLALPARLSPHTLNFPFGRTGATHTATA